MKSFFHFLELVFQEMNSYTNKDEMRDMVIEILKKEKSVLTDTDMYWEVLRKENVITLNCLFQLMFEFRNENSDTNLENRDPYEAVRYEFGANAFYFNLPYEFGDYMDFEIENMFEHEREALEDFVKLVEKKICK